MDEVLIMRVETVHAPLMIEENRQEVCLAWQDAEIYAFGVAVLRSLRGVIKVHRPEGGPALHRVELHPRLLRVGLLSPLEESDAPPVVAKVLSGLLLEDLELHLQRQKLRRYKVCGEGSHGEKREGGRDHQEQLVPFNERNQIALNTHHDVEAVEVVEDTLLVIMALDVGVLEGLGVDQLRLVGVLDDISSGLATNAESGFKPAPRRGPSILVEDVDQEHAALLPAGLLTARDGTQVV
mmetsp:Transcript_110445/g.235946  ORF Transcript_110445/g.235946 Transcript_110445/m.235946 type:complete len:238 (+) Transcript_110445:455-1168(+)